MHSGFQKETLSGGFVFVKYNVYSMFLFQINSSISLHTYSPMQYLHNSDRNEYTRNIQRIFIEKLAYAVE